MKEIKEVRSRKKQNFKTKTSKDHRRQANDKEKTSTTPKLCTNPRRCSLQHQPKFKEEEEQSILTETTYNAVRNNRTTWNS